MISLSTLLKYYKQPEIQHAIVEASDDKEIAVKFGDKGFGRRPDVLKYPKDVLEFAKKGATSFHCSEELWHNPLQLNPKLSKKDMVSLRQGWDLVLDIDCKELEFAKLTAVLLMEALEYHGVKSTTIKFSGNNGFHLGVPFEAFPKVVNNTPIQDLFPDGPRKIAAYLKDMIRNPLSDRILKRWNLDKLSEITGIPAEKLSVKKKFNPYTILDIDTILISPRHLYRMPFSLHEKSGLASVPITKDQIMDFKKTDAHPSKVKPSELVFLDRKHLEHGEAKKLLLQALDFKVVEERVEESDFKKNFEQIDISGLELTEGLFPPCIKLILAGIKDGRKRATFVLINFLRSVGWGYDKIEDRLKEWNKVNEEELREVLWKGQLRYHKQNKKKMLPPNCDSKAYYLDMHVCKPDALCKKVKNPVNYTLRKAFFLRAEENAKKRKEEQKEARKKAREAQKQKIKEQKAKEENKEKTSGGPKPNSEQEV